MDLKNIIGLGVAGNFTGHLEQAGESASFADVKVKDHKAPKAPKALFPFYLPEPKGKMKDSFLKVYPLSSQYLLFPADENAKIQLEPEIGLLVSIVYDKNHLVKNLVPESFGAYNDCSIRREGAVKISTKKNWGINCKGVSDNLIPVGEFSSSGVISSYRISCFLKRDGLVYDYGVDSAAKDYSYMYEELVLWMKDRMNEQKDEGPAENIHEYLKLCSWPDHALISIGATRYTEFGQTGYVNKGDISYVVVYPEGFSHNEIVEMVSNDDFHEAKISVLRQEVI